MDELDLIRLDRQVSRVVAEWVHWRRRLRRGAAREQDPFAPHAFVSRHGFEQVRDLPAHDPLRLPMLRWLFRLVDDKASLSELVALSIARARDVHPIEHPERARLSLAEMLARALGDRPRAAAWLEQYLAHAATSADLERRLWDRRREVAERLKVDAEELELPERGVYEVAVAWLRDTDDRAGEYRTGRLQDHLASALGLEAHEGWPARLGAESLAGWFREARLLDALPLDPGPLPRALAPASFVRALARLGAAFADAAAPRDQPFVVAHDAYGLRRLAHGALFAGLVVEPAFLRRALGIGTSRAKDHRRVLARVLFHESRARAFRLLLRRAALSGEQAYREAFEEQSARLVGEPLPARFSGALFAPRRDEAQRFVAMLLAAARTRELVEDHDEDWYRNPRAVEQLRAEAAIPPAISAPRAALEEGASALSRQLLPLLG